MKTCRMKESNMEKHTTLSLIAFMPHFIRTNLFGTISYHGNGGVMTHKASLLQPFIAINQFKLIEINLIEILKHVKKISIIFKFKCLL